MTAIYALRDPRTKEVRYVGKSMNNPKRRASMNIAQAKGEKRAWLLELQAEGLRPVLEILEPDAGLDWDRREAYWIARMQKEGHRLTNVQRLESLRDGESDHLIRMRDEDFEYLRDLGEGQVSRGIREALRRVRGTAQKA